MPERYGKYKTVDKHFTRWARAGVWKGRLALLARDCVNEYLMIEGSIVRAQGDQASGAVSMTVDEMALLVEMVVK